MSLPIRTNGFRPQIIILLSGLTYFVIIRRKDHKIAKNSQYENLSNFSEIIIKSDPKVIGYCGSDLKLSSSNFIQENNNKNISFNLIFQGIRGEINCQSKWNLYTHESLENLSNEQIEYSKLSKHKKNSSIFNPIDFNDVILPTENVVKLISDYNNSQTNEENKLKIKELLNENIKNNENLWILDKLTVNVNENIQIQCRPISSKSRKYEIDDTFYTVKTYQDILDRLQEFKENNNIIQEDVNILQDELRMEMKLRKFQKYEERRKKSKFIFITYGILLFGTFIYRSYSSNQNLYKNLEIQFEKFRSTYKNELSKIFGNTFQIQYVVNSEHNKSEFYFDMVGDKKFGKLLFRLNNDNLDDVNLDQIEILHKGRYFPIKNFVILEEKIIDHEKNTISINNINYLNLKL